jgi:hypothetical protein
MLNLVPNNRVQEEHFRPEGTQPVYLQDWLTTGVPVALVATNCKIRNYRPSGELAQSSRLGKCHCFDLSL